MALTKKERAALERLREVVALERASLTPPKRAVERGYADYARAEREPSVRPLARDGWAERNGDILHSNAWTNDVAESLKIYFGSWAMPIIDALLEDDRAYLAQVTGIAMTETDWREQVRKR